MIAASVGDLVPLAELAYKIKRVDVDRSDLHTERPKLAEDCLLAQFVERLLHALRYSVKLIQSFFAS